MPLFKRSVRREKKASEIIRKRVVYAATLGLIPIPILDVASIFASQVLMVRELAKVYRVSFEKRRVETFIGILLGDLGTLGFVKLIPGLGSALGGAKISISAAAATYAIGKVFTQHFHQGGTLFDFDPVASREYFWQLYQANRLEAKEPEPIKKSKKSSLAGWIIGAVVVLLAAAAVVAFYYFNVPLKQGPLSDADLFRQDQQAKRINLSPTSLDSTINAAIVSFDSFSTEGVVAKYLQDSLAVFPRRFSLNAVRFPGSSVALRTGAQLQMKNFALLMEKYPNVIVQLYGHTSTLGGILNRQRIGRERARALKEVLVKSKIDASRVVTEFLEKEYSAHHQFWGADIVIDVATKKEEVLVKRPQRKNVLIH
ncbi:MAG: DUF697 domain-containing protein [Bacteroidota bacterium]